MIEVIGSQKHFFKNVCFNRENAENQDCQKRVNVGRQAHLDQRSGLATTEPFERQSSMIITDY